MTDVAWQKIYSSYFYLFLKFEIKKIYKITPEFILVLD